MRKVIFRILLVLSLAVGLTWLLTINSTTTAADDATYPYFCPQSDETQKFYNFMKSTLSDDFDFNLFVSTTLSMIDAHKYDEAPKAETVQVFQDYINYYTGNDNPDEGKSFMSCQDEGFGDELCSCFHIYRFLGYVYQAFSSGAECNKYNGSPKEAVIDTGCKLILDIHSAGAEFPRSWPNNTMCYPYNAQGYPSKLDQDNAGSLYDSCRNIINLGLTPSPDAPEEPTFELDSPPAIRTLRQTHPSRQDFNDMSQLFVPYIREVLNNCRDTSGNRTAKSRCDNLREGSNDHKRLEFLLALVAHGSNGTLDSKDHRLSFSSLSSRSPDFMLCPTEGNPLCHSCNSERFGSGFGLDCPTLANLSSFLPMVKCTKYNLDELSLSSSLSRYDILCQTKIPIKTGVTNLKNSCSGDGTLDADDVCKTAIDSEDGFLSSSKTAVHQLQTMYWNMIDVPPLSKDVLTTWTTITDQERKHMREVIDNPLDIEEPLPRGLIKTSAGNMGFAGQCSMMDPGLGYIICSLTDGMIKMVEEMVKIIHNVIAKQNTTLTNDGAFSAWRSFLNIANVFFIIVFLVIIFSQLTGRGVSSYGIKTMLPKLIIAAILANISFFGVRILMEISSIVGSGLFNLMVDDVSWKELFVSEDFQLTNLVLTLLMFVLAWLVKVISLTAQVILLTIRAALMVLVAITAPLAAVLYILPGTAKITKTWWRTAVTTALIHPVVSILCGAGIMAFVATGGGAGDGILKATVYRFMIILPMFAGPFVIWQLFKKMPVIATAMATIGHKASSAIKRTFSPDPKSERGQRKAEKLKEIDDRVRTGDYRGWRPVRRLKSAAFRKGLGQTDLFAQGTTEAMQRADQARDERSEGVSAPVAMAILNDISAKRRGGDGRTNYRNLSNQDRRTYDQRRPTRSAFVSRTDKEAALDANLAFVKDSIRKTGAVDGIQILKNLQVAHEEGASQVELSNVYRQIMGQLEENNQMVAIGELKANLEFNNNRFGIFDQSLYDGAMPDGSALSPEKQEAYDNLYNQRKTAVRTALNNGIVNRETPEDGTKLILNANMFPDGSLGAEVFQEELRDNESMREAIETQSGAFSASFNRQLKILDPTLKL